MKPYNSVFIDSKIKSAHIRLLYHPKKGLSTDNQYFLIASFNSLILSSIYKVKLFMRIKNTIVPQKDIEILSENQLVCQCINLPLFSARGVYTQQYRMTII